MPLSLAKRYRYMASSGLLLALLILASAVSAAEVQLADPLWLAQLQTIAVCTQTTCSCGGGRLIIQQNAPCEATSSTGDCRIGSGQCCVCEAPQTVASCANSTCECNNSRIIDRVYAPCTVTSSVGRCEIGSGQCCVCGLDR